MISALLSGLLTLDLAMLVGTLVLLVFVMRLRERLYRHGLRAAFFALTAGTVLAGAVFATDLAITLRALADAQFQTPYGIGDGGWIVLGIAVALMSAGFWHSLWTLINRKPLYGDGQMELLRYDESAPPHTADALRQIRMVTDSLPILFAYVDVEKRFRFVNRTYEIWFDQPQSQIEGSRVKDLIGRKNFSSIDACMDRALTGEFVNWNGWIRSPTMGPRHIQASFVPDLDDAGLVQGFTIAATDTTERREIEESLERSEQLLFAVMNNMPAGITIKDLDGNYMFTNARAEAAIKAGAEKNISGLTNLPIDEARALDDDVLRTGRPLTREVDYSTDDRPGTRLVTKFPITGTNGRVTGVGTVATEITEIKETARALKESEARLRDVMDHQSQIIGRVDLDGRLTFVNDATCRLYDMPREAFSGMSLVDNLVPEERREDVRKFFASITKDDPINYADGTTYDADGNLHWFHFTNKAILDENGEIFEYQFSGEDITERKRAEEARREAEDRLQQVMDAVPVLIAYFGPDHRYRMVNKAYERWFGKPSEEIVGQHVEDVIGEAAYEQLGEEIVAASSGRSVTYERAMTYTSIGERYVQGTLIPVPNLVDEGRGPAIISVVTDITNIKRAEDALRQSEERYRAVVDSQTDLVGRWLPDGTRTFVNDALCRYYGKSREELLGESFFPDFDADTRKLFADIAAGDAPADAIVAERQILETDDEPHWVQWIDTPIVDENGVVVEFQSVGRDVTERKKAEHQLRESETRYRRLVETINDGLIIHDEDANIVYVNDKLCEIWQLSPEELIGTNSLSADDSEFWRMFGDHWNHRKQGRGTRYEQTTELDGDGQRILAVAGYPIMDGDGSFKGSWAIVQDVTEQKMAEQALRHSERQLRLMTNAFPQYISYIDAAGKYQFVNEAHEKFFRRQASEIVGQTMADMVGLAHYAEINEQVADALRGNQVSFDYDAPHSLLAGETLSFHANYIPDLDNLGRVKGFYAITVDMTEHKRTQDALEFAMLEAEQANLSKSRFLAAASHDLRQPLQSMRLLLHTLENNDDPARQAQAIKGLSAAVSVTSTLLDALLDISKLDAGVIQPEMENVNIATMMEDMAARYQAQAEAWGVDLRTVSSSLMVHTDPVLLERVVGNFMSNALKFADGKKVLLGCRRRGDRLAIEVWDQGAGIPVEHQEKIFEEFYQFGRQRADTNKGLGLGLAIATRLSHLLDQPIDMRSTPGKGSMFSVTVPLSDTVIGVLNRAEQEAVA